jgi:type II secretory pathway component PulF
MRYHIEYIDSLGNRKKDVFIGNLSKIQEKLQKKGSILLKKELLKNEKFKDVIVSSFFSTLSDFMNSGVGISKTLFVLQNSDDKKISSLSSQIHKYIIEGRSFSFAIRQLNIVPDTIYSIIQSGENSGKLAESFVVANKYMEDMKNITKDAMKSLSYPMFLLIIAFAGLLANNFFVIPKILDSEMVQMFGEESFSMLNSLKMIVSISCFSMLMLFIVSITFYIVFKKNPKIIAKLRIKLFRKLFTNKLYYVAFFNLYQLLKSGVKLSIALNIVHDSSSNKLIRSEFKNAINEVDKGNNFIEGFKHIESEEKILLKNATNQQVIERILYNVYRRYEKEYVNTIKKIVPIINITAIIIILFVVGSTASVVLGSQASLMNNIVNF